MAILEIPTVSDIDRYSQVVTLDETDYRFLFAYNTRADAWILSVYTIDGEELATSIPIVTNAPLLGRWSGESRLPQGGFLLAVDSSGENKDPVKEDLGDKIRLVWVPLEDI